MSEVGGRTTPPGLKVWIDLANSPHPLIFAPVADRLAELGAEVVVTARNHAQTAELACERWPKVRVLGEPSPSGMASKAAAIATRVRELRRWARIERPDVALSHNSYAQVLAARSLAIPAVTAMDYEHQPANHLAFRGARRILVPRTLPRNMLRRQGATEGKLIAYDGFKEQIYLAEFRPDEGVLASIGVERSADAPLVVARTAPAGAAYHRHENAALLEAVRWVVAQPGVSCVVLARHPHQREEVARLELERVFVPSQAIDSRSLLWHADLFVGAGGTMSREAALLGIPSFSLFGGRPAAVDVELQRQGLLHLVGEPSEIGPVGPAPARTQPAAELAESSRRLIDLFCQTTVAEAR